MVNYTITYSKSVDRKLRRFFVLFFCLSILILISGLSLPVTGYLHSWNQVTTLSMSRGIAEDWKSWANTQDVVTRVTWFDEVLTEYSFTVFEEFPAYHMLAAILSHSQISLESSCRIVSIFCFFFLILGAKRLSNDIEGMEKYFFPLMFLCSYPYLFYGQAIMSDIAMVAFAIWSIVFCNDWVKKKNNLFFFFSLLLLTASSLMKSYGLVVGIIPAWAIMFCSQLTRKKQVLYLFLLMISAWPIVAWHVYTLGELGYQEVFSHSIFEKIATIFNASWWLVVIKYYFKYLGYIFGILGIVATLFRFVYKGDCANKHNPWWLIPWGISGVVFVIVTADKIPNHDYYFLLVAPPVLYLIAKSLQNLTSYLVNLKGENYIYFPLSLFALSLLFAMPRIMKARMPNDDVISCAKSIEAVTTEDDLIASYSDISRYNSLAYYSGRKAVHVEESFFPLSRYRDFGAKYLVINLRRIPLNELKEWLSVARDNGIVDEPIINEEFLDRKGRIRFCQVYELSST